MPSLTHSPRVQIGMPLYNNERTIRRALDSVLAQTFAEWTLCASDDGSRDATVHIVKEYAAQDSRISIVEQATNLNYGNFRVLLQFASAPLFVFLAGDDWFEPDYLSHAVALLDRDRQAVAAIPRVLMHPEEGTPYLSEGATELTGAWADRLSRYLADPGDNSRMYGVFRTDVARKSFPARDYHAFDWTFSARTLLEGTHVGLDRVLLHREVTANERYIDYARRDSGQALHQWFPVFRMTLDLLREAKIRGAPRVLSSLGRINWMKHRQMVGRFYPRWDRLYYLLLNR